MKKLNVKNIVIKCLISLLLVSSIVMLTNNNITLAYFTSEEVTSDISQLRVNYTHPGDDFFNIIRRFKDNSKKIQRSLIVYYYNDSVEDLSKKNLMTMATDLGENYNEYYRYMVKLTDEQCKAEGFDEPTVQKLGEDCLFIHNVNKDNAEELFAKEVYPLLGL